MSKTKRLLLIRHGESYYNDWMRKPHRTWLKPTFWLRGFDPGIRDAVLTERGKDQATARGKFLSSWLEENVGFKQDSSFIVVVSPLTRALQTHARMQRYFSMVARKTIAYPGIREVIYSRSDLGLEPKYLIADFPCVDFDKLGQNWWLPRGKMAGWTPYLPFGRVETEADVLARVDETKKWIKDLPDDVVVMFGHSMFWRYFTGAERRLQNCEMLSCTLDEETNEIKDVEFLKGSKQKHHWVMGYVL